MKWLYTILALLALAVPAQAQFEQIHTQWQWIEEFAGGGTFGTSAAQGDPWVITDTSSAGTPTYVRVDLGESTVTGAHGSAKLTLASNTEVENVALTFGDKLAFDWDKIYGVEYRIRFVGQTGSAKDAATQVAFGLVSDRNDDPDATTAHALFRLAAASTSMAVTVETDDGVTNNDDVATTLTMTDSAWYRFRILFTSGTDDVRFYANAGGTSQTLTRLASATTFDADQYHGGVQPILQIWKSSDSNTDSIEWDFCTIWGTR